MAKAGLITKELLLAILAAGGIITLAAASSVVPGLLGILNPFMQKERSSRKLLRKSFTYLKRKKYIRLSEHDDKIILELTENGKTRALAYQVDELSIKKPRRWDEIWRLVIFDVPVEQRVARDMLRWRLKLLGFHQLQESVWIHAYPCDNEIKLLSHLYKVGSYVKILEVIRLPYSDEKRLRRRFHLEQGERDQA